MMAYRQVAQARVATTRTIRRQPSAWTITRHLMAHRDGDNRWRTRAGGVEVMAERQRGRPRPDAGELRSQPAARCAKRRVWGSRCDSTTYAATRCTARLQRFRIASSEISRCAATSADRRGWPSSSTV